MEPAPAAPETASLPNSLCRDCGTLAFAEPAPEACGRCGSVRIVAHRELATLAIAHVDCDAFYASVEKRDHPDLIDEPLIVGGSQRGVVLTACYIARRYGVRSAMPMARALQLCPGAAVIKPDMEKYRRESRRIRDLMEALSPRVESVSIDEAYLDLSGCGDNEPPARSLARLALQIEKRVGVTISIGLAANKMLAKIASDFGKPRGFYVIGESDKLAVLAPMKVSALSGVGPVMTRKLEEMGYATIADLRKAKLDELTHRFGRWGRALLARAHGEDARRVGFGRGRNVSVGAERTFAKDLARLEDIAAVVEQISQRVAERLVRSDLAATSLTLKLRRHDRYTTTHACRLHDPTQRAETILAAVMPVLRPKLDGTRYRLVGVTAHDLVPGEQADPPDLFDRS
ncbi:MAG TPA: DNA polymerase IV [Stellaceae bacterium]|jgi:DNA polymerase-4|nr:DNA polymerase IV [Stellaceae bacterium]